MTEELIEEIDWNGNVLKIRPKSELKQRTFPHKVALIIPSENGKLLLCKRAATKHPFPGVWCCAVGGKIKPGETPDDAATREMHEEIGIAVALKQIAIAKHDSPETKELLHIYTTTESIPSEKIHLDPSEVEYLKAFTLEEIQTMIAKNPKDFAPAFLTALHAYIHATR